ncbi:MAG: glucose 1-dehydrogenase [Sphingomonadales bacterium]|nr:glucose 1-dehydrogenase [Sphingomonadales bacterium]
MTRLAGKVAIVTGASKGIGAGIARGLGEAGAAVAVNYASSRTGAERVVAAIEAAGGRAIALQGDVSQRADVERMIAATIDAFGRLDIVVNNAAYFTFGPIEEISEAEFHRHFDTNVLGTILVTQAALPHLQPGASILNLSSAGLLTPTPLVTLYTATKAAIAQISGVWAKELGPRQIRVNVISPGSTETEGNRIGEMDEASRAFIIGKTALGRVGEPADIAPVAVFLASDEARWVTGTVMQVSGGFH